MVLMAMLSFAGCGIKEPEIAYEYGTYNQSIEETFDIKDGMECKTKAMSQKTNFSVVVVNTAQTEEGGWGVWDDGKYIYTAEDVGSSSICSKFINRYY